MRTLVIEQKRPVILQPKMAHIPHHLREKYAVAMHGVDGEMNGLFSGLKKRIRIKDVGRFAKKNINLKTGIAVAQIAAPLASTIVPVGGGLLNKLAGTKVGNLVQKVTTGKAAQFVKQAAGTKVGQVLVKAGSPLVKSVASNLKDQILNGSPRPIDNTQDAGAQEQGASTAPATASVPGSPNPAQKETLDALKGTPTDAQQETYNALKGPQDDSGSGDTKKDNTLLYVGVSGLAVIAAIALSKKGQAAPAA